GCTRSYHLHRDWQSVSDLIGGHLSSQRQIEQVDLERLHWTGRQRIVESAFRYLILISLMISQTVYAR
ncbi:hypothetical protein, partial [Yersinia pestis]|uniref:hypothetical protein n=1 Tax=Yersinia pestis TaxID=632 RepID=UPI001EE4E4CF